MSDQSFQNAVAKVKMAYNIVDVIQQNGTQLQQKGSKWKGLCPFHNEKTPSFTVDENFQNYYCFGCHEKGDIFTFVAKTQNLEFKDALVKLADDKNITLDFKSDENTVDYKTLREILKETANFYHKEFKKLSEEHPAKQEILKRGLSLKGILYGYAPEKRKSLTSFLLSKGFTEELILKAGVATKFENSDGIHDFWNGRLMFFITDITGKPIGFSGRKLYESDKRGKYVNSPDSPLFDKSNALFNLSYAKKDISDNKSVIVTEGQFDVAAYVDAGLKNVVASSGTAFTEKQANILRRLVTEQGRIIFAFDGDNAGTKAAIKVFEDIPIIHDQAYAIELPANTDPCDILEKQGKEKLHDISLNNQIPLIEYVLNKILNRYDLKNAMEKSNFVKESSLLLAKIKNNILRDSYSRFVALEAGVSLDNVILETKNAMKNKKNKNVSLNNDNEMKEHDEELPPVSDSNQIIELFKNESLYKDFARLLNISMRFKEHRVIVEELLPIAPKSIKPIMNEVINIKHDVVFPELFNDVATADYLIHNKFFPFADSMNSHDFNEITLKIKERICKKIENIRIQKVRSRITSVLDNREADLTLLEKAINKETSEIKKIRSHE